MKPRKPIPEDPAEKSDFYDEMELYDQAELEYSDIKNKQDKEDILDDILYNDQDDMEDLPW